MIERRRAAAAFLPRVTLSPSYFARDGSSGVDHGLDLPLSGSIDVSPVSDSANLQRSESEIERRRALLFVAQDALLVDVARTLFEAVRAERSGAVLESSLAVQQARVDDVRARRDVGFARPLDVSLSEAQAADTRVDLLEARRAAATGRALLAFLIDAALDGVALDGALEVPGRPACLSNGWRAPRTAARSWWRRARASTRARTTCARKPAAGGRRCRSTWTARARYRSDQDWRGLIEIAVPIFEAGLVRANVRDALSPAARGQVGARARCARSSATSPSPGRIELGRERLNGCACA